MDQPKGLSVNNDKAPPAEGSEQTPAKMPFKKKMYIGGGILLGYWLVCLAIVVYDTVAPDDKSLVYHGIIPRTGKGFIPGIIATAFIHDGWGHLGINAFGYFILGGELMFLTTFQTFFAVTGFVWFFGGFFTWLVGRPDVSIVCGTALFSWGWFGYLVTTPCFKRPFDLKALGIAILTGVLYGGVSFSIFKGAWEASLCSIASGVLCAVVYWLAWLRWIRPKYFPDGLQTPNIPNINFKRSDDTSHHKLRDDEEKGFGDANFGGSTSANQFDNSAIVTNTQDPFGGPDTQSNYSNNRNNNQAIFGNQDSLYNNSTPSGLPWMDDHSSTTAATTTPTKPRANNYNANSSNPSWLTDSSTTSSKNSNEVFSQPKGGNLSNEVFNPFG